MSILSDLSVLHLGYFFLAALIVGFTKTSVGGVGILAVVLLALVFPGKASPGILLPMLLLGDIFAVVYYRRDCQWHIIARLLPFTAAGIALAYFLIDFIPPDVFRQVLGWIILFMLVMSLVLEWHDKKKKTSSGQSKSKNSNGVVTHLTGFIAGIATMVANAAGPFFSIYMLRMGLKKEEFVGTRSWFFLIVNLFKIPFSVGLGLITPQTLTLNLISIPVVVLGAYLGYVFLKRINIETFKWLIRIAVVFAATRLISMS